MTTDPEPERCELCHDTGTVARIESGSGYGYAPCPRCSDAGAIMRRFDAAIDALESPLPNVTDAKSQ